MKQIVPALALLCTLYLLFFLNSYAVKEREIQIILDGKNQSLESSYKAVTQMYRISIENYFKYVIMQPRVIEILRRSLHASEEEKALLRGNLYRYLYPLYQHELIAQGIRQLHFHTEKGESFLRFHQPNENGDLLIDVRATIKKANEERTFVSGFEGGRIYPGFRYVYPIVDQGTFLGTVELSLSYERIVAELSKLLNAQHYLLLLNKETTTDVVFEKHRDHFVPSMISERFMIENPSISSLSDQALKSPLLIHINTLLRDNPRVQKLLAHNQSFSIPLVLEHQGYSINFYPIFAIDNRLGGYVTTYDCAPELVDIENKYLTIYLLGFITLTILTFGLYLLLVQRKRIVLEKIQFETIVTSTVNGVILLTNDGAIRFVNAATLTILGYREIDMLGKNAHRLIHVHPQSLDQVPCPIIESIAHQRSYVGEELFRTAQGEHIFVHVNLTPFIQENRSVGSVMIFRNITEEKKAKETIEHLAYYDSLTELPNRKLLLDRLNYTVAMCARSHEYCGLLFIDLDNFKNLNDTLGHEYGDVLLQKVAKRLQKILRHCDTVARFGGDEFVVLITQLGLNEHPSKEQLRRIAHKVLKEFSKPFSLIDCDYECSASIGGTLFWDNSKTINDILKDADIAMYAVKRSGKNKINIA
ncbi:diguanylate cyclase [Sulfurospirillum sp. MES]|uniref:diguanylate cyclase domain-containing protein n=1 Tax=Sulfurospirillum sp. MES TaxID=1565314 RepID=UPI00054422BB|nr:diguanylate cyclase [Sulfurospirillum sp. MES]KHG34459.1 MAG: hypothetical protein OA34_05045 [Sulfurospirillum sp. MES]